MKKIFIVTIAFLFPFLLMAQDEGIQFVDAKWEYVLKKAKQENKLIFVDMFTTWCAPCKRMALEVFPQKEVGDKFNASFINYKVDAEKGEGIDLAKMFEVDAFPTYLFINGDGKVVYRILGRKEIESFLKEADKALNIYLTHIK
ncbi:MAG TPA: thioredoxin family protein [Chondromyces sp.]|nr:thioredoxin family protein [Chondromyces sp.]